MSWAIWITGPPASGKSTIARAAAERLRREGVGVRVLELDEIRRTLTPTPRYTAGEREVVYRALGHMARLLTEAGVPVVIDATAHRRAWRNLARASIPRFAEVQLSCPLPVCRERERVRRGSHAPPGIYARAGRPAATVPGVDVPYEPALAPELSIDTDTTALPEAVDRVVRLARALGDGSAAPPPGRPRGWAIWITGRPGSGKTAVAEGVRQALAAEGERVQTLDVAAVRRALLGEARASEAEEEIVHRALAFAARLLTEAGVAVIVDATAHRRAWRETARALIPSFAEVQLVCPEATCLERERAGRWGLGPDRRRRAPAAGARSAPDLAIDYEESARAELRLRTDIEDLTTTVERVLLLVRRLQRTAPLVAEPPEGRSP